MLGKKKKAGPHRVGAKEKAKTAKLIGRAGRDIEARTMDGPSQPALPVVLLIFFVSTAFAFMITENNMSIFAGMTITGIVSIDSILTGTSTPSFVSSDIDKYILILLRGVFVTLLTGLVPFMTHIFGKMLDKANGSFYLMNWGTISTLLVLSYGIPVYVVPFVNELLDLFVF